MTMRIKILALLLMFFVVVPASVASQDAPTVERVQQSLLGLISTGRPGHQRPNPACARAHGGCDARLNAFATYLVESGARHGVDPLLLSAMAFRESSLNPFATGATRSEGGIMQINPCRSDVPPEVRIFIGPCPTSTQDRERRELRSRLFRRRCEREIGACQQPIVDYAARLLASCISRCGSVASGLTAYNGGGCGESDYATRVLRTRSSLDPE